MVSETVVSVADVSVVDVVEGPEEVETKFEVIDTDVRGDLFVWVLEVDVSVTVDLSSQLLSSSPPEQSGVPSQTQSPLTHGPSLHF